MDDTSDVLDVLDSEELDAVDTLDAIESDELDALASMPPGLRRARLAASLLDDVLSVPGTDIEFGLDAIANRVSDEKLVRTLNVTSVALSLYIVAEAARNGVGRSVVARMLLNLVVDAVVGKVPVVGGVLDVYWKANLRNVGLFERAVSGN